MGSVVGVTPGRDVRDQAQAVRKARESFLQGLTDPHAFRSVLSGVRSVVADSWNRCSTWGLDPEVEQAPEVLSRTALRSARKNTQMATVLPVLRTLLGEPGREAGHVMAIGDAEGRLLWVEGDSHVRSEVGEMGFVEGALWREDVVGTNAPGTALATGKPTQIVASEHYLEVAQTWSCAAVPLHDPIDGSTIGVVDVTGRDAVAGPHALALVRAAVAAAEAELRLAGRHGAPGARGARDESGGPTDVFAAEPWRLEFLGSDHARATHAGRTITLSQRHSELLLLLVMHPHGLTADRMAVLLHDYDIASVTVRAELTRLRKILGPGVLASRPYRLAVPFAADVLEVSSALSGGRVDEAVTNYAGSLMPSSEAPAVAELRDGLRHQLRRAAMAASDADVLVRYAQTEDGAEDLDVLHAALQRLPSGSSRRALIEARIDHLDALYG